MKRTGYDPSPLEGAAWEVHMRAKPGDIIVVDSVHTSDTARRGIVVSVSETGGVEHYVVRWDDDRETMFYPGSTAHTIHVPAS